MEDPVYQKAIEQALNCLNEARKAKGLSALEYDPLLSQAAQSHAQEMADGAYISHWDERGDRPHHRYFRLGIRDRVSENVWGQEMLLHDAGAEAALNLDEAAALKLIDHIQEDFNDSHSQAEGGTGLITDADRQNREGATHTHVGLGFAVSHSSVRYVEVYADRFAVLSEALPFQLLATEVNQEENKGASFVLEGTILHPLDMGPFAVTVSQESHPGLLHLDDDLLLQTPEEAKEDEHTQALCSSKTIAIAYPWDISYNKETGEFKAPLQILSIQESSPYHVVLYVRADPSSIPYDRAEEGIEVPGDDPSLIPAASWVLNLPQTYGHSEAGDYSQADERVTMDGEEKEGGIEDEEGGDGEKAVEDGGEEGGIGADDAGGRRRRSSIRRRSLAGSEEKEGGGDDGDRIAEGKDVEGGEKDGESVGEEKNYAEEKGAEGGRPQSRRNSVAERASLMEEKDGEQKSTGEASDDVSGLGVDGMASTGASYADDDHSMMMMDEEMIRKAEMLQSLQASLQEKEEQRHKLLREQVDVQRRLAVLMATLKAKDLATTPGTAAAASSQDSASGKDKEDAAAAAAEAERQYIDGLHTVLDLKVKIKREREEAETAAGQLEYRLTDKQGKAEDIASSFRQFKREIALSSENSRTGKPIPLHVVNNFQTMETKKDEEMEGVRLKNIMLRMQLKKLQKTLRAKEQLAEGLHLIDFEQLKIENQTLSEKIEERNEELQKLRKKNTITVQVLTHVKEKLQFLSKQNTESQSCLTELDQDLSKERERLRKAKKTRDSLRAENAALKQSQGLGGSNELLITDYEQRKKVIEAKRLELAELKEHHSLLMQQASHRTIIAESKE